MAKCFNCGQESCGDFCQWCNYPLMRRIFIWRARRNRHPERLAEQPEMKVKQIVRDVREKARKETRTESARIIGELKQKAAKLAQEMNGGAETEAEKKLSQVVEEARHKAEEIVDQTERSCMACVESLNSILIEAERRTEEIMKRLLSS